MVGCFNVIAKFSVGTSVHGHDAPTLNHKQSRGIGKEISHSFFV
jgi:hypothetical protein